MDLNEVSTEVGNAASKVHKELGPFLIPSIYQSCVMIELQGMGMRVQSHVPIPVFYRGKKLKGEEFEIDLLVENELVVQTLSLERVPEFHIRRILMYLQIAKKPLGLLINFGERLLMTAFDGSPTLYPFSSEWAEVAKTKFYGATL